MTVVSATATLKFVLEGCSPELSQSPCSDCSFLNAFAANEWSAGRADEPSANSRSKKESPMRAFIQFGLCTVTLRKEVFSGGVQVCTPPEFADQNITFNPNSMVRLPPLKMWLSRKFGEVTKG